MTPRQMSKIAINAISLEQGGATRTGLRARAGSARSQTRSVAVVIGLVGPFDRQPDIGRLLVRHFRKLDPDLGEVKPRDLFVEVLRQRVDLLLVFLRIAPQFDLREPS